MIRGWQLLALGAFAATAPAQAPSNDASTALHAAWLREVMDLDPTGAANDYEQLAKNARSNEPERWLAIARLAELRRFGIAPGPMLDAAEAPAPVRTALANLPALPDEALLPRLCLDPTEVLQALGTEQGRMPQLRAASSAVLEWVRSQLGPTPRRSGIRTDRSRAERIYALDVLQRELEGRQHQAANLRTLYFTDWKAPVVRVPAKEAMATVQANLEAWLAEKDLGQFQHKLLEQLRDALVLRAQTDPAAAIELLQRIPLYAERLLGPVPAAPATGGSTPSSGTPTTSPRPTDGRTGGSATTPQGSKPPATGTGATTNEPR